MIGLGLIAATLCGVLLGFCLGALATQRQPASEDGRDAVLDALSEMENRIMSKMSEFNEKMEAMDAATNEIASDLQALRDQIAGGLSADDATAALATLDAKIARLQQLGADPENPVPVEG